MQGLGLCQEHDGNGIPDFVDELAGPTDKALMFLAQFHPSLALGAGDNFKKFFLDHGILRDKLHGVDLVVYTTRKIFCIIRKKR
jgi:hypothetical protein